MERKGFTKEQIFGIPKEHEAGASALEVERRYGVSGQSICCWKAKFGGMSVSEARRLRELEQENSRERLPLLR